MTPSEEKGIIIGVTEVRIENDPRGLVWVLDHDDDTYMPRWSAKNGDIKEWYHIDRANIVGHATPVATRQLGLPSPMPVVRPDCGVVVAEDPPMTEWQKRAFECFSAMHGAAAAYRDTTQAGELTTRSGICDNIGTFTDYDQQMVFVKDNLIRTLPSYSGEYHYPVKTTGEWSTAERAWDYCDDKWVGDYGLNRLNQLAELIEAIKHNWNDALIANMTHAQRAGLKIGDLVWDKNNLELLEFYQDDGSRDPYFKRLVGESSRVSRDLSFIELNVSDKLSGLPVADLIKKAGAIQAERERIRLAIVALEEEFAAQAKLLSSVDFELAYTHKVKRIA